jgi:outer membrane protein assembly factor BamB
MECLAVRRNRVRATLALFVLLGAVSAGIFGQVAPTGTNWPSFRGLNASGVAEGFALPSDWNVPASRNVKWTVPIAGLGHSSPIVWGDRLFVTTAISGVDKPALKVGLYGDIESVQDNTVHRWLVTCLDKRTGKSLWEKTVHSGVPKIKRHPKSTHANSTLATDGRRLVALFGSEGIYAFDLDGNQLWKRDLGVLDSAYYEAPEAQWEYAASPVIYQDMVFVQCDVLTGSFVAALSLKDGSDIWRVARNDVPTWSTPAIVTTGAAPQVLVNGYRHMGAYDARTGKEIWRLKGGGDIPVPTPVLGHGMAFFTNAHGPMAPIFAIRLNATGDISLAAGETSNQFVAWSYPRDGAYMITPIVYGDLLYSAKNNGVLSCFDARTGNRLYQQRLGDGTTGFTASPVAGDGKVYFSSEDGDIYVIKAGPKFELLAKNAMGEICMASPAISGGVIYFRTQAHVVAIDVKR